MTAITRSDAPVFRFLLKNGANRNMINALGSTSLCLALNTQLIQKRLFDQGKVNADIYAIESRYLQFIIDTLNVLKVPQKASPSLIGQRSALERAQFGILVNDSTVFFKAMADGAEIEGKNKKEQTLLALAIENSRIAMARYLLIHSADVNATDELGDDIMMAGWKKDNPLAPALIVPSGRFNRYGKTGPYPPNREGMNYLEVVKTGYNYTGYWMKALSALQQGVTDAMEIVTSL